MDVWLLNKVWALFNNTQIVIFIEWSPAINKNSVPNKSDFCQTNEWRYVRNFISYFSISSLTSLNSCPLVSPMIWVPNQLVGAPAGTDVTVDCHTEAHPRAISYWVYDNVMVLPTKKYAINTEENSYRWGYGSQKLVLFPIPVALSLEMTTAVFF